MFGSIVVVVTSLVVAAYYVNTSTVNTPTVNTSTVNTPTVNTPTPYLPYHDSYENLASASRIMNGKTWADPQRLLGYPLFLAEAAFVVRSPSLRFEASSRTGLSTMP